MNDYIWALIVMAAAIIALVAAKPSEELKTAKHNMLLDKEMVEILDLHADSPCRLPCLRELARRIGRENVIGVRLGSERVGNRCKCWVQ